MKKRSTKRTDFGRHWDWQGMDCTRCGTAYRGRVDAPVVFHVCRPCFEKALPELSRVRFESTVTRPGEP